MRKSIGKLSSTTIELISAPSRADDSARQAAITLEMSAARVCTSSEAASRSYA